MSTQAIPIPQGATVGIPIPEGATVGDPTPTPQGFWASVKNRLQFGGAGPMGAGGVQAAAPPPGVSDTAWQQQKQALKDSFSEMVDNVSHPSQLLHMLPGWDEVKKAVTPKEIDQIKAGDTSGAAGTALVDIANLFAGGKTAATTPEVTLTPEGAVRGAARGANTVLHNAPDVIPSALVPPVIKKAAQKLTIPGENFGIDAGYDEAKVAARAAATKARQGAAQVQHLPDTAPPASPGPTAADRQAYFEQIKAKRAQMNLPAPEATPAPQEAAGATSAAQDSAELVKYKAGAAKAVGADSWESVPPRIQQQLLDQFDGKKPAAAPATVSDVIDQAIPPDANKGLNMRTKAKVDFYVQKGNVTEAKQAIQEAAQQAKPSAVSSSRYDEIGTELTASYGKPLSVGERLPARAGEDRTLEVTSLAGKTATGGQWYRFKVVPLDQSAMMSSDSPLRTSATFTPGKLTPQEWADKMDDLRVKSEIEAREGTDMVSTAAPKWKLPNSPEALLSDATRRKAATSSLGKAVMGEEQVPLPGTAKGELQKQMKMPGGSLPAEDDLTSILQKSIDEAKKKRAPIARRPNRAQASQ